jgi:glucose/arabinose dehydrogenase
MKIFRLGQFFLGTFIALGALVIACGGNKSSAGDGDGDDSGDGDGDGDGSGTGGVSGDGDGDVPSTGGSGTGGGDGTGGGTTAVRVPGTDNYNCEPPTGTPGTLQLTQIASGYDGPVLLTHAPNDPRLFIVEQGGLIKIVNGGTFLDISNRLPDLGDYDERGLLGLAFSPDYATSGLFYVHYNRSGDGATVIAEYSVSGNADVADENSERVVLTVNQPFENHNGGTIAFGGDGYLYVALGDGGGPASSQYGGDPDGNGQNAQSRLASILRIDPKQNGGSAFTSPAGNFPGAFPEIWSIGLRNPYRINFDGCTGDLYIGDVGQNVKEEVNVVVAGDGGKNFGWRTMEGTTCFNTSNFNSPLGSCENAGLTPPVLDYDNQGGAAIVGGAVYRGSQIPWLRGTYFYGDQIKNWAYSTVYNRDTGVASTPVNRTSELSPTSVVAIQNGHDGELYFVLYGGSIHKLEQL